MYQAQGVEVARTATVFCVPGTHHTASAAPHSSLRKCWYFHCPTQCDTVLHHCSAPVWKTEVVSPLTKGSETQQLLLYWWCIGAVLNLFPLTVCDLWWI